MKSSPKFKQILYDKHITGAMMVHKPMSVAETANQQNYSRLQI